MDNTILDGPGSGGDTIVTAAINFSGDVGAKVQGEFVGILSGVAESYVYTLIVGGAGAVTGGVQRVTLASDDPAVALLTAIDLDTSKITACNTGAVVVSSGTITTVSSVTAIANALPAGTNLMGKVGIDQTTPGTTNAVVVSSGTGTTVSSVTAIANALPVGDNNIGNVDLVSLPAGNLGQQAKAASLSVAPATDITDATYIGDIKFGEALPTGTNLVGGVISLPTTTVRYDGTTACTVYEFMVVGTTAGNNTLVTPTAGKKVRLLHLEIIALSATANTVYVVNGDYPLIATAANPIPIAMDADGDNHGGFITGSEWRRTTDTVTEAVVAVQSATAAILYMGTYIEVD